MSEVPALVESLGEGLEEGRVSDLAGCDLLDGAEESDAEGVAFRGVAAARLVEAVAVRGRSKSSESCICRRPILPSQQLIRIAEQIRTTDGARPWIGGTDSMTGVNVLSASLPDSAGYDSQVQLHTRAGRLAKRRQSMAELVARILRSGRPSLLRSGRVSAQAAD